MKIFIINLVCFSAFLFCFHPTCAQDSVRMKRVQEAMRTLVAGPEHEILKQLAGEWSFETKVTTPKGQAKNFFAVKGKTVNRMILENRFLISESSKDDKNPLAVGLVIFGFDRGIKKYTTSVYSEGGTYAALSSGTTRGENFIHTEGTFYNPVLDVTELYDIDIELLSKDKYRLVLNFKDQATRSTMSSLIIDYTRQKSSK